MRKAPLALAIGGLAILVIGLMAGRSAFLPNGSDEMAGRAATPQASAATKSAPAPAASATSDKAAFKARAVGADLVAIPPVAPQELVRIEPREPLSPFGRPLPPPKPDYGRIRRPLAEAAGRIVGDGLVVTVEGVDVVEPDELCADPDGFDWPCGMRARTAFRGLLRGRAISCDVPEGFEGNAITAPCILGKLDLGAWLVANGWGRATPGGPYEEDGKAARDAQKGIFGFGPEPLPLLTAPLPDFINDG